MTVENTSILTGLEDRVAAPLSARTLGRASRAFCVALGAAILIGLGAWIHQLHSGLGVTGMNNRVTWGLYVTNFVFFIGISMAGTFVSAMLRLVHAEWRRPITRIAEVVTASALLIAATMIIVDMGRPDRLLNTLLHPHLRSPILWDVISLTTYLAGSAIYLWLPLVPDLARMRGRAPSNLRNRVYAALSLHWNNTPEQRHRIERAMHIMAIAIIPTAVAIHTVTAWIFSMTLREGWNSTIFAPYFVVGALYSGIATIILVVAIIRRVYHLEELITERHFRSLGILMLVSGVVYAYFTLSEYLTIGYKMEAGGDLLMHRLLVGSYAPIFWTVIIPGTAIPIALLSFRRSRVPRWIIVAAFLANIGMWLKRYVIVVPSLALPLMPTRWGLYRPTWIEWAIVVASFAAFAALIALFARLVPVVSVWESEEGLPPAAVPRKTKRAPARPRVIRLPDEAKVGS